MQRQLEAAIEAPPEFESLDGAKLNGIVRWQFALAAMTELLGIASRVSPMEARSQALKQNRHDLDCGEQPLGAA
jgi:hypothetical protein